MVFVEDNLTASTVNVAKMLAIVTLVTKASTAQKNLCVVDTGH